MYCRLCTKSKKNAFTGSCPNCTGKTVEDHVHAVEVLCIYFETSQNGNCSVYVSIVHK